MKMKFKVFLVLLSIFLLIGCSEKENEKDLDLESKNSEVETNEEYEYKNETVKLGEYFDFRAGTLDIEFLGITLNNIQLVKTVPMSEEEKAKSVGNDITANSFRDHYEQLNSKNDFLIIDWKIENKLTSDLKIYPNFIIENSNGMQIQSYVDSLPHLSSFVTDSILSPGGVNEGTLIYSIPEGNDVSKVYILNGNHREYSDVFDLDISGLELKEEYIP